MMGERIPTDRPAALAQVAARAAATIVVALSLLACSGGKSDLKEFVERIKARSGGSIEPLPEFEPYESFKYEPSQLRDPFLAKNALEEDDDEGDKSGSESEIAPDKDRPKEPLEEFALDSLVMVGTLSQEGKRWGLIRDPKGTVHRVLPGNYMGKNYGRVVSVKPDKIELVELIPDGEGGWRKREAAIALSND